MTHQASVNEVFIVEDEEELSRSIVDYLEAFGIAARAVTDAEAALARLAQNTPEILLLDVNLPGISGFELCRSIRSSGETRIAHLPIIFLTARASEDDEVLALSIGGDDYLRKPFPLSVLLAKIRRILARSGETQSVVLAADAPSAAFDDGWLRVDPARNRVYVDGKEVTLPAKEYQLLEFLLSERERVVGKQELLDRVWQDAFVGDGTLSVHIRRLRLKIERDPDTPRYLRTMWGRGYMFTEEA